MILFGCMADDFTGASDAASFLAKGGLSVQLFSGIPGAEDVPAEGVQAVVIALKSRTQETKEAIADTLRAAKWLKEQGAKQFYLKYCATFDSTPEGNIGPVADAVMEYLGAPYTILCPALPVNGRTVRHGNLYVNGIPLHESHMKDHPLTPMWDMRIANLMAPQSRYGSVEIPKEEYALPKEEILANVSSRQPSGDHFYVIPDYEDDADRAKIVELFGDLTLLTGGSGLLQGLAAKIAAEAGSAGRSAMPDVHSDGLAVILAGSCSRPTLAQIADFLGKGGPGMKMDPEKLLSGEQTIDDFRLFMADHDEPVLIYSSDSPDKVKEIQENGKEDVASLLEGLTAELADFAVETGVTRVIVAGGETSGAVTKRLGYRSFRIGQEVAPGVPVMIPVEAPDMRIVLKSGGFGQEDFFERALRITGEDTELANKLDRAVWVAHSLFERGKTSGSSANLSFMHEGYMYITCSGTCFGTLEKDQFARVSMDGTVLSEKKPSKEWPLHLAIYRKRPGARGIVHTHSPYSILWSCVPGLPETDCIPDHTPYLKMKVGTVGLVPYEKPGSKELFSAMEERIDKSDAFLLIRHGPVVAGKDIMDAFYGLEELEESAKIAWELRRAGIEV